MTDVKKHKPEPVDTQEFIDMFKDLKKMLGEDTKPGKELVSAKFAHYKTFIYEKIGLDKSQRTKKLYLDNEFGMMTAMEIVYLMLVKDEKDEETSSTAVKSKK